jgi:hypothetical protein
MVYYVMRSKNEVLCVAAGRLAAERSEADKPANIIYYYYLRVMVITVHYTLI